MSLAKVYNVTLVVETINDYDKENAETLEKLIPELKFYFLKEIISTGKSNYISKLKGIISWRITKFLARKFPGNQNGDNLFINSIKIKDAAIIKRIQDIVSIEQPDIFQVDFTDNADIILALPKDQKKLIVVHDLRFSGAEQLALTNGYDETYIKYVKNFTATSELSYLRNYNAIITFSQDDADKLVEAEFSQVYISPFAVDDSKINPVNKKYAIEKLIFIGPGSHYPNYDAVKWYAENLSDLFTKKFGLQLMVIGKWNKGMINSLSKFPSVHFSGFVNDLKKICENAAMIVPLRIGSGIRTKILDAFAIGLPVISTSVGIEGIGAVNGREFLKADTAIEFVNAVSEFKNNPEELFRMRISAQALLKNQFSQSVAFRKRQEVYESVLQS